MQIGTLAELPGVATRLVIVNVNTDVVATRALFSALRLAPFPALLLNCDPSDRSRDHFCRLMQSMSFDLMELSTRRHGELLDWLFSNGRDEVVFLLDSDAEIHDPELVAWMAKMVSRADVFGAGYVEGPFWMDDRWSAPEQTMLYMERPWMPFVALDVAAVRRALAVGVHFSEVMVPNEMAPLPRLGHLLASRFGPPYGPSNRAVERLPAAVQHWLAGRRLDGLAWTCGRHYGLRPKIACYDTGGALYAHLRYECGMRFAGLDVELGLGAVDHYGGITRNARYGPSRLDRSEADVAADAARCLLDHYDYVWKAAP